MTVSEKLDILQKIITDDDELNQTLDKLLDVTRAQYQSKLEKFEADLQAFERRYGMNSEQFYRKFEAGELGDAMDFFEWAGVIELRRDIQQKIEQLDALE